MTKLEDCDNKICMYKDDKLFQVTLGNRSLVLTVHFECSIFIMYNCSGELSPLVCANVQLSEVICV